MDRNGDVGPREGMERALQDALDKRRYERFKAGIQVKFRVVGPTEEATLTKGGDFTRLDAVEASVPETRDIHRVLCEDISLGGVRIATPAPLAEGTRLWLQISIPDVPLPVSAVGEVRWSGRHGSLCSSGLRFHSISRGDLGKVERFITLRKGLGQPGPG